MTMGRRILPYACGVGACALVTLLLMWLADASGTFSGYVGFLVGFNVYAYVLAGVSRGRDGWRPGMPFDAEASEGLPHSRARNP